jgi:hypothetical protein
LKSKSKIFPKLTGVVLLIGLNWVTSVHPAPPLSKGGGAAFCFPHPASCVKKAPPI